MGSGYITIPSGGGNWARINDVLADDYTTSLTIETKIRLDDEAAADEQTLLAAWSTVDLMFRVTTAGKLDLFQQGALKATSDSALSISDGEDVATKMDLVVGAGDGSITFSESTDAGIDFDSMSWSEISAHTGLTIAADTIGSDFFMAERGNGNDPMAGGRLYRTRFTPDGSPSWDADFTALTQAEIDAEQFEESISARTVLLVGSGWTGQANSTRYPPLHHNLDASGVRLVPKHQRPRHHQQMGG